MSHKILFVGKGKKCLFVYQIYLHTPLKKLCWPLKAQDCPCPVAYSLVKDLRYIKNYNLKQNFYKINSLKYNFEK
jgi:hypothetical protein